MQLPAGAANENIIAAHRIACDWNDLRAQILKQWDRIAIDKLDAAGPNRRRIALLIAEDYTISPRLIENYLLNFERTLPVAA